MRLRRFNVGQSLNKLDGNKNNKKTKHISVIISLGILILAILYFSFAKFQSIKSYSLINGTVDMPMDLISYITRLKRRGSSDLAYDGVETLGELGTSDNNLRYIGDKPNNYVYFNCSTTDEDEMNDSTCEKWRIIGVMNNIEDEYGESRSRVKIIKSEGFVGYSWDSSDQSINQGDGINQWGESTYQDGTSYEGADLMRELNTDYLGNITVSTDGRWYNNDNNSKMTVNFTPINDDYKKYIETINWRIGPSVSGGTAHEVYNEEKSTEFQKRCSGKWCNDKVVRTTSWVGKVALMYASDYMYATSGNERTSRETCLSLNGNDFGDDYEECENNSWLLNNGSVHYTLTPYSGTIMGGSIKKNYSSGNTSTEASKAESKSMVSTPVLYLKNSVNISSGDGTSSNPYKIYLIMDE